MELIEIAPGIDLEKDILALMDFKPVINNTPRLMDERLFKIQPMNLKENF
jgi:propionate CoA-transferase